MALFKRFFSASISIISANGKQNCPPSTASVTAPLGASTTVVILSTRAKRIIIDLLLFKAVCAVASKDN